MTALERVTNLLHRARVRGGWDDEYVALEVLRELDLAPATESDPKHTASELELG